jgi:hypothetical protein
MRGEEMTYEQIRNEAIKLKADLADDPPVSMGNAREMARHYQVIAFRTIGLVEALAENLVPRGDLPKSGSFHSD